MLYSFNTLIENEFYICCPLLNTGRFIDYCKKRAVNISRDRLERLEKLGLFYPFARINRPEVKIKIKPAEEANRYYLLGILEEGEIWDGETKKDIARFSFKKDYALEWMKEGILWSPQEVPFKKWKSFEIPDLYGDGIAENPMESYYSQFQVYQLFNLLQDMSHHRNLVQLDLWYDSNEKEVDDLVAFMKDSTKKIIELVQNDVEKGMRHSPTISYVCQAISNRYYPETRTDQRSIIISSDSDFYEFDWYKYKSRWDAKKISEMLGTDKDVIKETYEQINLTLRHIDPLYDWEPLVSFVSVSQKDKLKDNALLAQSLYSMGEMLAYFYKDLTGEDIKLPIPDADWKVRFYGDDVLKNSYELLEYIVNQYHLNPRPRLILFVEGNGEKEQIPRIAKEIFGYNFSNLGIIIKNLKGVGEFGRKGEKGGKLLRFIEHYHQLQTIVFVLLDNEGRAGRIKNELTSAITNIGGIRRKTTKEDYIHLWELNIEFDNFSDKEIANAMTIVADERYEFTLNEIKEARATKKGKSLESLYRQKLNYDLNKRALLKTLFDQVVNDRANEFDKDGHPKRKILVLTQKIIMLAARNHQPISKKYRLKNQKSGYFGEILEE